MNRIANATIALSFALGSLAVTVPLPAAAQGSYAVEQRFQDMERLITQLTGQVERLQNQVQQLQQQLERQQADYDYRLQQIETGRGGGRPPAPPPRTVPPPGRGDSTTPGGGAGGQPPGPQGGGVRPLGSTPSSGIPPSATGGTPDEIYGDANTAMRNGDYPAAERSFRAFVERYPRDPRAGSAQYWLGETYYVRKDYQNAAAAYAKGFRTYRNSSAGPENLLRLGMSLHYSGKTADACTVYGQFGQIYPLASAQLKGRVVAERQRSGCR